MTSTPRSSSTPARSSVPTPPADTDLQEKTADALEELLDQHGAKAIDPDEDAQPDREALYDRLENEWLSSASRDQDNEGSGRVVLLTAGPPGAGKSTGIRLDHDYDSFAHIDADTFKGQLLDYDLTQNRWDDLLAHVLPDQKNVRPAELAALVHRESTRVADGCLRRALAAGLDVVVHGTMQWEGLVAKTIDAIDNHALPGKTYRQVDIEAVDPGLDTCRDRALDRWWDARCNPAHAMSTTEGRFTPAKTITSLYDRGPAESICVKNARDGRELLQKKGFECTLTLNGTPI